MSDDHTQREERLIQRDLARKQELEEILTRFHARASTNPELWKDRDAAGEALRAASELRSVNHEIDLTYFHQQQREEVLRRQGSDQPAPSPLEPERVHRAQVLHAREGYDHEVDQLRALGLAPELVRRTDRQRRALLRWLLGLLAGVQPEAAGRIERDLAAIRSRSASQRGPSIARRERETVDWLVCFLEPLLPE